MPDNTTKTEKVPYAELTKEQVDKMLQTGDCPFCHSKLNDLTPASSPKARELYCSPCHWSYPIGRLH